jgi:competence protein ComEC
MLGYLKRQKIGIVIFVIGLVVGLVRGFWSPWQEDRQLTEERAVVISTPIAHGTLQSFTIRCLADGQNIEITTYRGMKLSIGDVVEVTGAVRFATLKYPSITNVNEHQGLLVESLTESLRTWSRTSIQQVFPAPYSGLIAGIVFGRDEDLDPTFKKQFRQAGISHILVASGYNVGVVVSLMINWRKMIGRYWALGLTFFAIGGYILITGFDPPIMRAVLMVVASLAGGLIGRQVHAVLWLFYIAILMLIVAPQLISSLSFQLSFAATLGILTIKPIFDRIKLPSLIKEDVGTTLSAYMATLPISIIAFGVFNPLGIVVNILVLWTVPIIMFGALLSLGLGLISNTIGQIVAIPVIFLLQYMLTVINFFIRT